MSISVFPSRYMVLLWLFGIGNEGAEDLPHHHCTENYRLKMPRIPNPTTVNGPKRRSRAAAPHPYSQAICISTSSSLSSRASNRLELEAIAA